jgi:hypothetical protein
MKRLLFLPLFVLSLKLVAQQGFISAGGDYSGVGGTMSNSTGQTDFMSLYSIDKRFQFGNQQVYFEDRLNYPTDNLLQGILIPESATNCFNATQTITTAGDGTTFIVEDGATAELIAGQNIIMLPGTLVKAGGYMNAQITTNSLYCFGSEAPMRSDLIEENRVEEKSSMVTTPVESLTFTNDHVFFSIYPNPTTGKFTLELNEIEITDNMVVTVFGIRGERIQQKAIFGNRYYSFDLESRSPGIYLVHVLSDHVNGIKRIIKN